MGTTMNGQSIIEAIMLGVKAIGSFVALRWIVVTTATPWRKREGEIRPMTESRRLQVMVSVYEPALNLSIWQDYGGMICQETGEELLRSKDELIQDLRRGVNDGEWTGWRLVRIEKEEMKSCQSS